MISRRQIKTRKFSLVAIVVVALVVTAIAIWQPVILTTIVERGQAKVAASEYTERKPVDQSQKQSAGEIEQEPKAKGDGTSHEGGAGHEQAVALNSGQLQDLEIKLAVAEQGPIASRLERLAEIKFDSNRVVHVVPRVD